MRLLPKKEHGHIRYPGERSGLRFFDHKNQEDIARLKKIVSSKNVLKWMDDMDIEDGDLASWVKETKGNSYLFAVTGAHPTVTEEELGKVQGFIYFYTGEKEEKRVKKLVEKGILPKELLKQKTYEMSSARLPDAAGGQMSSASRQASLEVRKLVRRRRKNPQFPVQLYCFIDPKNEAAIRAAEASGYVYAGKMKYDRNSDTEHNVYLLDWKKLRDRMVEIASSSQ